MRRHILLALLPLLAPLGCDGGPSSHDSVSIDARAVTQQALLDESVNQPPPEFADASGTLFALRSGTINLRDIELDLPTDTTCEDLDATDEQRSERVTCDEDKIRIEGPFLVDLTDGTSTPSLDDVTVPAGTYTRIDLRVDDAEEEDGLVSEDHPMHDRSMVASADFTYQDDPVAVELSLKFNEDIRVERDDGIEVSGDADLLLAFVVDDWFDGVDLAGCLDDGDLSVDNGLVVIDDDVGGCSDVENDIKDNLKDSLQLDKSAGGEQAGSDDDDL